MMPSMQYCPKCLGTGLDIDNNPCECRFNAKSFYDTVSCLTIPPQYRGIHFNKLLVPKDVHESYANVLQDIHDNVVGCKWSNHNVVIASPINHSKTILAYSCIETLFRNGIPTFPIYDLLEIKRIILDMDLGREQFYDVENPEQLYTVPTLFVKIPRVIDWAVFDTFATLLDRRVRRGNSTIFLYDGVWNFLVNSDKSGTLSGLMGDGTYNTIDVKAYSLLTGPTTGPVEQENIG